MYSKTKQEMNTDGQREGRGVRGEKGRNRSPGPSTREGRWKDCPITESERGSVLRSSGAFRPATGKHRLSGGRLSRDGATLSWKESTGNFQRSDASDWKECELVFVNSSYHPLQSIQNNCRITIYLSPGPAFPEFKHGIIKLDHFSRWKGQVRRESKLFNLCLK